MNRFSDFTRREIMWITLALAWARVDCIQGDDPVLVDLFHEATDAVKATREHASEVAS